MTNQAAMTKPAALERAIPMSAVPFVEVEAWNGYRFGYRGWRGGKQLAWSVIEPTGNETRWWDEESARASFGGLKQLEAMVNSRLDLIGRRVHFAASKGHSGVETLIGVLRDFEIESVDAIRDVIELRQISYWNPLAIERSWAQIEEFLVES